MPAFQVISAGVAPRWSRALAKRAPSMWTRSPASPAMVARRRISSRVQTLPLSVAWLMLSTDGCTLCRHRLPQQATEGLLAEGYTFYHDRWAPGIVRLVTSFSPTPEDIDQLLDSVRRHTR